MSGLNLIPSDFVGSGSSVENYNYHKVGLAEGDNKNINTNIKHNMKPSGPHNLQSVINIAS